MINYKYPGLMERVKALIIDAFILTCMMFLATSVFSTMEEVPDTARIAAFVFIFILYNPILTSSTGGTLGHRIVGIRVKRAANEERNINFPLAIGRFIVKAVLGWISLLTISGNERRMAIHDIFINSVVVYKKERRPFLAQGLSDEEE